MAKSPKKANKTGLSNKQKNGIENLSGYLISDVKIHCNSSKSAQLSAKSFSKGNEIHPADVQEKHLPHESWHVVQRKHGRVKPISPININTPINDNNRLEDAANELGKRALDI